MNRAVICLLLFFAVEQECNYARTRGHFNPHKGKIWALLVAGSNGWINYRHQADICHAYQLLHNSGIPDKHIVVMMFDDIAFNNENPTPGVIINFPGGPNVYKDVLMDYTGYDVNPRNFLNILIGNKTAMRGIGSGKVIESGPDDMVFVNFVDHGGPGILYFPDEEPLFADELLNAIDFMTKRSKFSKLIMYIEACYSGSMFDNLLPDTTNVFALTATDPHESSYAGYFDERRGTYLGDVFSLIWMNDTEHEGYVGKGESLHHQFAKVRTYTDSSHVQEYGDLDIGVTRLKEVLGSLKPQRYPLSFRSLEVKPQHPMDTADTMDIPLIVHQKKINATKDTEKSETLKIKIDDIMKERKVIDTLLHEIIVKVTDDKSERKSELKASTFGLTESSYSCYKKLYNTFSNNCFTLKENTYARVLLEKFTHICSTDWVKEDKAIEDIKSACSVVLNSKEFQKLDDPAEGDGKSTVGTAGILVTSSLRMTTSP